MPSRGYILFRILLSLLFLLNFSYASLVGGNFDQYDLKVLEDLDIDSTFITDYKLQKIYSNISKRNKSKYVEKLNDASLFLPKVKEILKKNNIPAAFLYLVMAESNFTLDAKSHMKAAGLWQFIPLTAKKYGLKNNMYVDERMDIVKSTEAAVKYLKSLHKRFGKWYLAAIAYNCGEGRVIEAITRATLDMYVETHKGTRKNKKIREFRKIIRDYQHKRVKFSKLYKVYKYVKQWKIKPDLDELLIFQKGLKRQYLPGESQRYIRKIISLAMLGNRNFFAKDSSYFLNRGIASPIVSVKVKGGTHLNNIAELIGVKPENLLGINRHIRQLIVDPEVKECDIYIPYSRLARFNANINDLKPTTYAVHIVKPGDTLGKIGNYYKVSYRLIKKFNNLKTNIIGINQKLVIPIAPENLPKKPLNYFVKRGDTLSKIARMNKIDLKKLMRDNKLKSSLINIGDKLVINYQ